MTRIFLMGMKHCGKSTLGRLLAPRLDAVFADLDERAEELFARKTGQRLSAREIFRTQGREAFMALEAEALREICKTGGRAPQFAQVVAWGGGTIENQAALSAAQGRGLNVFLDEEEDVLFRRIAASGIPPFLQGSDPQAAFHRLYEYRTPLYRAAADLIIDMRGLSPREGVEKIMEGLHGRQ
ncbi:MAG: shikimate kinase [Spirochaetales bacterium]|jgi:shikimate kinase|nr:shikimate kinase [Spirochaetales bacterium]